MAIGAKREVRTSAPEVLRVWQEYRSSGDVRVRDRLIFMFMPMVRHIVYRKVREIPAQYAWTRIHGAVLDELRRNDWAPRSLRRDERQINDARDRFLATHDRPPTSEELAAQVGMTASALGERLDEIALAEVGSLNRTVRADDSATIERIDTLESADSDCDPTIQAERAEAKERFRKAFARLTKQEREVAVLLYAKGWTLRDIGARLGVSESRVSQIHTQLRRRLYEQLSGELALFTELR